MPAPLNHNDRFDRVRIHAMPYVPPITIFNAILWIAERDTVDIAQYGQNLSTVILDLHDWEYSITKLGIEEHEENVITFRPKY